MASVPRGSNKPVSNVNQRFDNLTDNRVKLAAKLKVQSPAVKDILSFMGREPPFEVQMLDQDGKEKKDERCAVLEIIHARSAFVKFWPCSISLAFLASQRRARFQLCKVANRGPRTTCSQARNGNVHTCQLESAFLSTVLSCTCSVVTRKNIYIYIYK